MGQDASALTVVRDPGRPRAAVLVLHGGQVRSERAAGPRQLAALRMGPVLRAIEGAVPDDVLIGQVRYRVRGWNGDRADPVRDTLQALDEVSERYGDVPVVLVGHSMGGRAALRAAGHASVRAVVGLAPWWPAGDPVEQTAGRQVVALHGDRDRITSAEETAEVVRRAEAVAARASLVIVAGGEHAMLRRYGTWHRTTAAVVADLLTPAPEAHPDGAPHRK